MDARENLLRQWLCTQQSVLAVPQALNDPGQLQLQNLCGDASLRRYFRWQLSTGQSLIAVDTPLSASNFAGFVHIDQHWAAQQIPVPEILAVDDKQGFMLLEDFADTTLLSVLNDSNAHTYYCQAIIELIGIQQAGAPVAYALPEYDRPMLLREMALFQEWLLQSLLGLQLTAAQQQVLDEGMAILADYALEQPVVCVHRDYHSRNLMVLADNSLGIIDFQDAVAGPVSYDIVSLLKDCYIHWPQSQRQQWLAHYCQQALQQGVLDTEQIAAFPRWFDLMGAQRHLKAAGIFARLQVRDGKPGYLADIPRTLGYITELHDYPALAPLIDLLESVVYPAMNASGLFPFSCSAEVSS